MFDFEEANLKIETRLGTTEYSLQSMAFMDISMIRNPSYVNSFGSFKIKVFDANKELIAQILEGVTYTTEPGSILNTKLWTESPLVSSLGKLYF